MKTLILYATKHGAAREIAQRIAGRIEGAVIHDLKQDGVPSLVGFDGVIIGSSVYAGMIHKEVKAFLLQNADVLQQKKLGLFLCGLDANLEREALDANIPGEILQGAQTAGYLGGIFDPKKVGFMERIIMKKVGKRTEYENTIDEDKIGQFVKKMRA